MALTVFWNQTLHLISVFSKLIFFFKCMILFSITSMRFVNIHVPQLVRQTHSLISLVWMNCLHPRQLRPHKSPEHL